MILILDIETQELVPANRDLANMHVSVAGIHDGTTTTIFTETQLDQLFALLDAAEIIAGHNLLGFDYKVLQRYASFDVCVRYKPKTFDLMFCIMKKTDRCVSLNDVAKRTLGIEKNGKGSDAPMLFREGRMEELTQYLAQDLCVTQALIAHIQAHGKVKYGHLNYKEAEEREIAISITDR